MTAKLIYVGVLCATAALAAPASAQVAWSLSPAITSASLFAATAEAGRALVRAEASNEAEDQTPDKAQDKKAKGADQTSDEKARKKAEKKAEKKADKADEEAALRGLVWRDRPTLRYGNTFRMDFRLKLQFSPRQSSLDLSTRGGELAWEDRRAGVKGSFLKYFDYEFEHDIYTGGKWRDAYLNTAVVPWAQVQVGRFKIPFGYERLTSPTDLDFVFRTRMSDALTPARATGVMGRGRLVNRAFLYQVGIFNGEGDNSPTFEPAYLLPGEQVQTEPKTIAARFTFAPLRLGSSPSKAHNLEIGAAVVSSTSREGMNNLTGRMVLGDKFFHRDFYTKGSRLRIGAEATWASGPFSMSTEYIRVTEARDGMGVGNEQGVNNTLPDIVSRGWYVAGSWVVTGERKEGGVKPRRPFLQGGVGAIEVAARFEQLRFASASTNGEPPSRSPRAANVLPNGDTATTVGINWYINKWVKIEINGIREKLDDPSRGPVPGQSSFWTVISQLQFVL